MSRTGEPGTPPPAPVLWVLADTAPAGQKGSMATYARLVEQILGAEGKRSQPGAFTVKRVSLALPERVLAFLPMAIRGWIHHAWIFGAAFFRLRFIRADLVHILDGSYAYIARWIPRTIVSVATSHDIIPFLQLRKIFSVPQPGRLAGWLIGRSLKGLQRVDKVIAVSNHTKKDLVENVGIPVGAVVVVHHSLRSEFFKNIPQRTWRERSASKDAYIFHIGNNGFYKNRKGVLRVFSRIHTVLGGVRLKMAGPPPSQEIQVLVRELLLSEHVDFIVDPDDATARELYRRATLFLFPSIYEGFGWPPLEAMAAGCPVVCSNAASLPEVVGTAALICSADDDEGLANACLRVLQDERVAGELIEKGARQVKKFNADKMLQGIMNVYLAAIQEKQTTLNNG